MYEVNWKNLMNLDKLHGGGHWYRPTSASKWHRIDRSSIAMAHHATNVYPASNITSTNNVVVYSKILTRPAKRNLRF